MRNTKRVFSNFDYRECDAFSEYLHKQSLQGWHFKEWKLGLVFEKGEPKDITYTVEVFPNGAEMDLRPGENVKEYAEFCDRAGWKLLDSQRKFCIFKRIDDNAVLLKTWENRKRRELEQGEALSFGNCKSMTVFGRYFFFLFIVGMIWNVENEEHEIIKRTAEVGRKKWYLITDEGLKMLMQEYERLQTMVEDGIRYFSKENS